MTGELLCIIPGPSKELRRIPVGDRWCFGCRARFPHDDVLLDDEEQLSYYEPVWVCECSRCHKDRTRFPGTDWA